MKIGEIWGKRATTGFFLFYKIDEIGNDKIQVRRFICHNNGYWQTAEKSEQWGIDKFTTMYACLSNNEEDFKKLSKEDWSVLYDKWSSSK